MSKSKTKKKCPNCNSKNVVEILYGLPMFSTFKEAEEGKLVLGGCAMHPNSPDFACLDCGNRFISKYITSQNKGI